MTQHFSGCEGERDWSWMKFKFLVKTKGSLSQEPVQWKKKGVDFYMAFI